ncbi:MAG: NAD(P)H-dependent glycerol-3-phosphate dehydrogenase [Gammaproteobacteria bacterium]
MIGGGAWGTALAIVAARAGRQVMLWSRRAEIAEDINRNHRNRAYLGEAEIPQAVHATTDMAAALHGAGAVLLVTPSETVRAISRTMAPLLEPGTPVILCAKGIEAGSGLLLTEVAAEELGDIPCGVLSGPTFAHEAAAGHLTAVTIASEMTPGHTAEAVAARLAVSMGSDFFRPYVSNDVVGVEVGGAVKNVIAIACGMMTGAGYAENTRAALIARGMDEMKRLAEVLGGRRETVTGLSGAGDLTLTCSSTSSRNMSLGVQLGAGTARADCFEGRPVVVEGERNAISVTDLARKLGVEMPIAESVRRILHDGAAIGPTFAALWARPIEAEPQALDILIDHPAGEAALLRAAGA